MWLNTVTMHLLHGDVKQAVYKWHGDEINMTLVGGIISRTEVVDSIYKQISIQNLNLFSIRKHRKAMNVMCWHKCVQSIINVGINTVVRSRSGSRKLFCRSCFWTRSQTSLLSDCVTYVCKLSKNNRIFLRKTLTVVCANVILCVYWTNANFSKDNRL